jgi:3-oxoadipate enol-lactonase
MRVVIEDLLAVLDEQKANNVILVGHSFGSYISQEITFLQPKRVAVIAVIGCNDITQMPPVGMRMLYRLFPLIFRLIPDAQLRKQYADQMGMTQAAKEYAMRATQLLAR